MFIDTNVWVYAHFDDAPDFSVAQQRLRETGDTGENICISRQILREYIAAVTRSNTWGQPMPMESAWVRASILDATCVIFEDGPEVFENLMLLCSRVSFPGRYIHDANIVATMLAHGEYKLLTFNLRDFRRFDKYIELVDPNTVQ